MFSLNCSSMRTYFLRISSDEFYEPLIDLNDRVPDDECKTAMPSMAVLDQIYLLLLETGFV